MKSDKGQNRIAASIYRAVKYSSYVLETRTAEENVATRAPSLKRRLPPPRNPEAGSAAKADSSAGKTPRSPIRRLNRPGKVPPKPKKTGTAAKSESAKESARAAEFAAGETLALYGAGARLGKARSAELRAVPRLSRPGEAISVGRPIPLSTGWASTTRVPPLSERPPKSEKHSPMRLSSAVGVRKL